jgi:hypothetical protein
MKNKLSNAVPDKLWDNVEIDDDAVILEGWKSLGWIEVKGGQRLWFIERDKNCKSMICLPTD